MRRPLLLPRPRYQGRPLPRPADDVEDQGLAFDVGTLVSRRRVLGLVGASAGAAALSACGASATSSASTSTSGLTEIPDETAGPYPGDGSNGPDVLEESGIVRSDLRTSFGTGSATAEGIPLELELTVLDMADDGAPFAGVAVYVWHCDRAGLYSMYSAGVEDENYLRGVQVADDDGVVRYTSIVPACYTGRWPHVHLEVYPDAGSIDDAGKAIATSQVALPKKVCDAVYATEGYEQSVTNLGELTLSGDGVFGDDSGGHQMAAVSGSVADGYRAMLTVPVDTATEPSGGGSGGAPGGEPPAGGQPPPG